MNRISISFTWDRDRDSSLPPAAEMLRDTMRWDEELRIHVGSEMHVRITDMTCDISTSHDSTITFTGFVVR